MEQKTPHFDYELKKWLLLYSICVGPHKFGEIKWKMQKILRQEIAPLTLCNIISDFQLKDYVNFIERKEPVYKQDGNILKYLHDNLEKHYFPTKKGIMQLLFGWEFAAPAISKESYDEISTSICAICDSEN